MKSLASNPSIAWFSALKHSDPKAIKFLIEDLRPRVINRLIRQGADSSEAEDFFMDVIEAIFRKIRKAESPFFADHKFEAYFTKACQWQWYKKYRKKRQILQVTMDDFEVLSSEQDIEHELFQVEQAKLLWTVFKQLGTDCQKILRLFILEEHPHQEIAKMMDYSYQYAKKKKYRCFQKLVEMIKCDPLYQELKDK